MVQWQNLKQQEQQVDFFLMYRKGTIQIIRDMTSTVLFSNHTFTPIDKSAIFTKCR